MLIKIGSIEHAHGILLFRLSDEVDLRLKSTVTRGKIKNDILIPTCNVREVISFRIVLINTQAATTMRQQDLYKRGRSCPVTCLSFKWMTFLH